MTDKHNAEEALDSAVISFEAGELDRWELELVRTRHKAEIERLRAIADLAQSVCRSGGTGIIGTLGLALRAAGYIDAAFAKKRFDECTPEELDCLRREHGIECST